MIIKYLNFCLIIFLLFPCYLISFGSKTFFAPRSKSSDLMAAAVGVRRLTNHFDQDSNYSLVSWMGSYDQNFDGHDITRYFFGSESLVFSGSRYSDRKATDIMADYFGLSTTAKS